MSIAPPRYAASSVARVGREHRTLTMFFREVGARAGWGTWLVVAFGYLSNLLIIILTVEFTPPGLVSLSTFFAPFASPIWPLLMLLVAATTGSGSIAEDLSSRAITLYLSRPIHLQDYLGAKTGAVAFWIGMVAIGPGAIGVILVALLGLVGPALALEAAAAFLALGLLATFFFTGLAVALSAWTARALYAGVAIFGIALSLEFAASAVSAVTGNAQVRYLGVFTDFQNVAEGVFRTNDVTTTVPWVSAVGMTAAGAVLLVLTWQRLLRVEVVGE